MDNLIKKIPLDKELHKGLPMQKHHGGDLVKVSKDLGFNMRHFTSDCEAIVIYSYKEEYGGPGGTKTFCIYIKGEGPVSWYKEHQLTLIEPNCFALLDEWEKEDLAKWEEEDKEKSNMAKKKKKRKPKHEYDGNCAECPNFGTKNCVNYIKKKKGVKKKKKIIKKIIGR